MYLPVRIISDSYIRNLVQLAQVDEWKVFIKHMLLYVQQVRDLSPQFLGNDHVERQLQTLSDTITTFSYELSR